MLLPAVAINVGVVELFAYVFELVIYRPAIRSIPVRVNRLEPIVLLLLCVVLSTFRSFAAFTIKLFSAAI